MVERRLSAWLRSALALFGIAGILLLAGCGGGSGAPNNPYLPPPPVIPPLQLLPSTLYRLRRNARDIDGIRGRRLPIGRSPPTPAYLPVPANVSGDTIVLSANNVIGRTIVAITVQDAAGTVSAPRDDQRAARRRYWRAASPSPPTRTRRARWRRPPFAPEVPARPRSRSPATAVPESRVGR